MRLSLLASGFGVLLAACGARSPFDLDPSTSTDIGSATPDRNSPDFVPPAGATSGTATTRPPSGQTPSGTTPVGSDIAPGTGVTRAGDAGVASPPTARPSLLGILPNISDSPACAVCVQRSCPAVAQCSSDPACLDGASCVASLCRGDTSASTCARSCFNGNGAVMARGLEALRCTTQQCGAACVTPAGRGGPPGANDPRGNDPRGNDDPRNDPRGNDPRRGNDDNGRGNDPRGNDDNGRGNDARGGNENGPGRGGQGQQGAGQGRGGQGQQGAGQGRGGQGQQGAGQGRGGQGSDEDRGNQGQGNQGRDRDD